MNLDAFLDTIGYFAVAVWALNLILCIVGIWRHAFRSAHLIEKMGLLGRQRLSPLAMYGARMEFVHEVIRTALKGLLLAICVTQLTQTWAYIRIMSESATPTLLGIRDFISATLMTCTLAMLTWWSTWESDQRPPEVTDAVDP